MLGQRCFNTAQKGLLRGVVILEEEELEAIRLSFELPALFFGALRLSDMSRTISLHRW